MQRFTLNEAEIAHINALRSIPREQYELILALTAMLSRERGAEVIGEELPRNVTALFPH